MSNGDYAEMIEIPVSTCEMVIVPKKRKKRNLRKKVIEKVNRNLKTEEKNNTSEYFSGEETATNFGDYQLQESVAKKVEQKKFTFDIIKVQVIAIFVLVVTIFATNIFWEDSGINNLIRGTFNFDKQSQSDLRDHTGFSVYSPTKTNDVEIVSGVMTIGSEGAIYSPCEGVVTDVSIVNEKYVITITHSDLFKTVIKNADYAYFEAGEVVYQAVPVCYSSTGGAEVLMYNGDTLLTDYTINNGSIIWQS